jgi:hypothetical protein
MSIYDEYKRFWKMLSKEQREALSKNGFDPMRPGDDGVPLAHRHFGGEPPDSGDGGAETDATHIFNKNWGMEYDINFRQMALWRNKENEAEEQEMTSRTYTHEEMLDVLRKVLSVLGNSLECTCLRLALGLPDQPTMTAVAETHNLTRAAVSARVKTIQRRLKLPPSLYMKSEHACKKLSNARRNKLK